MSEQIRPEDLLKHARAQARAFFEQYDAELQAIESAIKTETESSDNLLGKDQLSLFLRSLNTELQNALTEVRSSSERLTTIAERIRENQ